MNVLLTPHVRTGEHIINPSRTGDRIINPSRIGECIINSTCTNERILTPHVLPYVL